MLPNFCRLQLLFVVSMISGNNLCPLVPYYNDEMIKAP